MERVLEFNMRAKHKLNLANISTNKPENEYQLYAQEYIEPFKKPRRLVEDGGFEGRDSVVTKENETAEDTEEKRTEKLIKIQNIF